MEEIEIKTTRTVLVTHVEAQGKTEGTIIIITPPLPKPETIALENTRCERRTSSTSTTSSVMLFVRSTSSAFTRHQHAISRKVTTFTMSAKKWGKK